MLFEHANFNDLLTYASDKFKNSGIEEYDIEARNILLHSFNINLLDLVLNKHQEITDKKSLDLFLEYVEKRSMRIPFQYIISRQNFCGLDLEVNSDVLIPRFDTELLVEKIILENKNKDISILDLCTGSGAIALSLKKLASYKKITAVDISQKALKLAKKNADKYRLNIEFILSNMFENIKDKYDIIVSNPPYIPSLEIESLSEEVKNFEPRLALDGKEDGLYFYRIIAKEAKKYLKEKSKIYLEISYNQAKDIKNIFKDYTSVEIFKDLANKDRIAKIIF